MQLELPGRKHSPAGGWSLSPQVAPTRRPGTGDFGRATAQRTLGFVFAAGQEFQEIRKAGSGAGAGAGRGLRARGGPGGGPEPVKRTVAGRRCCAPR